MTDQRIKEFEKRLYKRIEKKEFTVGIVWKGDLQSFKSVREYLVTDPASRVIFSMISDDKDARIWLKSRGPRTVIDGAASYQK